MESSNSPERKKPNTELESTLDTQVEKYISVMANKEEVIVNEIKQDNVSIFRPSEEVKKEKGTFAAIIPSVLHQTDGISPLAEGGLKEIKLERIDPRTVEQYLLSHPVVPRGITIKVNRMVTLGGTFNKSRVEIAKSKSDEDGAYWKYCQGLYYNSGGDRLLKKWIKDTHGYGNGYLLALLNKKQTKILKYKIKHPIYFNYDKEKKPSSSEHSSMEIWKIKLDRFKDPIGYRDYFINSSNHLVPDGRAILIEPWRVVHLKFDTWGDELEGLSLFQYIHLHLKYMLNMEEDGALEVKHFGHLKYKFKTTFRSLEDVKEYAKEVAQMVTNDAIVLTDGGDAELLIPKGGGPFAEYYDKYMTLLAIKLGVPKDILETTGRNSNNAIMDQLRDDMFDDISADEVEVSETIRENLFNPACALLFGNNPMRPNKEFDYRKVPFLRFKTRRQDRDKLSTTFLKQSRGIQALSTSIEKLSNNMDVIGKERTKKMIDRIIDLIPLKQSSDAPGVEADESIETETEERKKDR